MKSGRWESAKARCPYYKEQDRNRIICSGLIPNSSIHVAFGDGNVRKEYEKEYCQENFRSCRIFRMEADDE